ncbi:MAG: hypothetical protein HYV07_32785 [Deltaproteobacteria bacterium]|nr:hypothetical protein [Deltaproteobacteria bacterium]
MRELRTELVEAPMRRVPWLPTLLLACATTPTSPLDPVTWPPPPDLGRIRFERAIFDASSLRTPGLLERLFSGLLGRKPRIRFGQPMGLAISDDGKRLYVADHSIGHVVLVDLEQGEVSMFAPDEPMGLVFNVVLDEQENVYVSDSRGTVRVFTREGELAREIKADFVRPTGLALDRRLGRLYVSDSARQASDKHRVFCFTLDGQLLHHLGPRDGPPAKGEEDGQLLFPTYLAVDPATSEVFVGDVMNFRVQVFDSAGKFVRKYGQSGDGLGAFQRLKGLAFDGFGNLYAVDGLHAGVQVFNRSFDLLTYFGGFSKKIEFFDIPSAIAIHPGTNTIYITNEYNARVNVYQLINTRSEDSDPATQTSSIAG